MPGGDLLDSLPPAPSLLAQLKTRRASRASRDGKSFLGSSEKLSAVLPKRCRKRFHACLHVCRHAWKLAGSSPGH
eukprot:3708659-Pyramimonas_sp.AAC.1